MEKSVLYKDVANVSALTNTICGCYTDLHHSEQKIADFTDRVTRYLVVSLDELEAEQAFRLSYGGGSEPNFEKYAINNSGVNIEFNGKRLVYFHGDETFAEQHTVYHELGHSLTRHLNLYDSQKMDKLYDFCGKGIKFFSGGKTVSQFADRVTYLKYLSEMQSEGFATAAMMLRTPGISRFGLYWERLKDMAVRTAAASRTTDKTYPSMKYYSSMPTEMAVIAKMLKYRLTGKDKQFFTADGNIDFVKLAKDVEATVLKSAYSPRTFQRLLNNDILGGVHTPSNGWFRYVPPATLIAHMVVAVEYNPVMLVKRHLKNRHHKKLDLERQERQKALLPDDGSRDTAQLNMLLAEDNVRVDLADFYMNSKKVPFGKYTELLRMFSSYHLVERGELPKDVLDSALAELPASPQKQKLAAALEQSRRSFNQVLQRHGEALRLGLSGVEWAGSKENRRFLWELKKQKEADPSFAAMERFRERMSPAEIQYYIHDKAMLFADRPIKACSSAENEKALKKELFGMLQQDGSVLYDDKALGMLAAKYGKQSWRGKTSRTFLDSFSGYISTLRRAEYLNRDGFSEVVAEKLKVFEMREQYGSCAVAKAERTQNVNLAEKANRENAASHYANRGNVAVADHIRTARQNLNGSKQNPEGAAADRNGEINASVSIKTNYAGKGGYDGY